MDKYFHF